MCNQRSGSSYLLSKYLWPTSFKQSASPAQKPTASRASYANKQGLQIFTKPSGHGGTYVPDPHDFRRRGARTPFFGVFDCLGYVSSVLGKAPAAATRDDYFAPLLLPFSKHLYTLAGAKKKAPSRAFIAFNELVAGNAMREVMLLVEANEAEIMPPTELDTALGATIGRTDREVKKAIQEVRWQCLREGASLMLGMLQTCP